MCIDCVLSSVDGVQSRLEKSLVRREKCCMPLSQTVVALCLALSISIMVSYWCGLSSGFRTSMVVGIAGGWIVVALHIIFTISQAHRGERGQNLFVIL